MKSILNHLRIKQKLTILAVAGITASVLPSYMYSNLLYKDYTTAKNERQGVGPALAVLKTLQASQQHRGISAQTLAGRDEAEPRRATKQQELEGYITEMETTFPSAVANQKIGKDWRIAVEAWKTLGGKVRSKELTVEQSYQDHTTLSSLWLNVLEKVRDVYELSLDPVEHTYFLHLASLSALPSLTESLGQGRAKGTGLLALQQATNQDKGFMGGLIRLIQEQQTTSNGELEKAYPEDARHKTGVFVKLHDLNAKVHGLIDLTQRSIVEAPELVFSPADYNARYTETINLGFEIIDATAADLKTALDQRLADQVRDAGIVGGGLLLLLLLVVGLVYAVTRNITGSAHQISQTVSQFAQGDDTVRARLQSQDELGQLGAAFDTMLDERLALLAVHEQERAARLAAAELENETLNDSIVVLIQAVAQISQKDLTIRVPVAEDVTGTVADALNLLTDETAQVLAEVTRISENVATASRNVKGQADAVMALANTEREQVAETAVQLAAAATAMHDIAALAQTCNVAGETAITRTQTALDTVNSTVEGIHIIRDTIRETEKRIKRLGERSQEIGGAVHLINGIAERTHILALNASMHAASAGEAGRGFAVVADEVQRLAENARQSTEQIAHLVNNIQTETTDTVATMNTVISQVVEGSRLAGQAGEQMRQTQQSTADLVASVRQIAAGAQRQAEVSNTLRDRAGIIVESTRKTNEQLTAQGTQTTRLLDYASRLVRAVRVFTLPAQQGVTEPMNADEEDVTVQMRLTEDELLDREMVARV